MKYLKDYKLLLESKEVITIDDIIKFSYYYSYMLTDNKYLSRDYSDFFVNYKDVKFEIFVISNNNDRKNMISYGEKVFLELLSNNNKMKKDFLKILDKINDVFYPNLLDIEDTIYDLIEDYPSIEYEFVINDTINNKEEYGFFVELYLDIKSDIYDELNKANVFQNLKSKFERRFNIYVNYELNNSIKMSNYKTITVIYTLLN